MGFPIDDRIDGIGLAALSHSTLMSPGPVVGTVIFDLPRRLLPLFLCLVLDSAGVEVDMVLWTLHKQVAPVVVCGGHVTLRGYTGEEHELHDDGKEDETYDGPCDDPRPILS